MTSIIINILNVAVALFLIVVFQYGLRATLAEWPRDTVGDRVKSVALLAVIFYLATILLVPIVRLAVR